MDAENPQKHSSVEPVKVDFDLLHQRAVLQVLLALLIPGGMLFALSNMIKGVYSLAAIELCFSLAASLLWKPVKTIKNPQRMVLIIIFPMFATVCYAIFLPSSSLAMLAWVYTIPVLAYSALGARTGFLVSSIFYLMVGIHLLMRYGPDSAYHDFNALLNLVVCAVGIWAFVHAYERARDTSQRLLTGMAITDPLTGLKNRLDLASSFQRKCERSAEQGLTVGVIMVDLDFFKLINDSHGHSGGDEVLRRVAAALTRAVRVDDLVFRVGGEEFCLVVPRIGEVQLKRTAEALRERIQNLDIVLDGKRIRVTGSLGAVMMCEQFSDLPQLLVEADKRLYAAKHQGRNRAVCALAPSAEMA